MNVIPMSSSPHFEDFNGNSNILDAHNVHPPTYFECSTCLRGGGGGGGRAELVPTQDQELQQTQAK